METGAEEPAGALASGPEADGAREAAEAKEPAEAGDGTRTETGATAESAAVAATDGVEIPRQQSAGEVADSEAGESART